MSSRARRTFKAPLDRASKAITSLVLGLLASIAMWAGLDLIPRGLILECLALVVLIVAPILIAYLFAPRHYILTEEAIEVDRVLKPVRIPISEVDEVRALRGRFSLHSRLWGSGGLFGYYGVFTVEGVGVVRAYVTHRGKIVYIGTRSGRAYLVSPDEEALFIQSVEALMRRR